MPKKSPKPARKVSEPRAKKGNDIPHPPIEAGHDTEGKAAEAGKDAAKLPAEEGVAFPYSFELVASTALHFLKQGVERNSAVQDAIRHLDYVSAILPSLKEEWCHNQRFWQAVERAEDLGIGTGGMQAAEEEEKVFLRGVGHIMGTRKGKDIQPFRRFLCLLSRTDDSLGTAILGLVTQPLKIPLISQVSVEQRRKICESRRESRAEKEEIDEWICNFRRGRFESMMLTILKNAFERLRQLDTAYQNSIKGALGGRGKKGGLRREKTRSKNRCSRHWWPSCCGEVGTTTGSLSSSDGRYPNCCSGVIPVSPVTFPGLCSWTPSDTSARMRLEIATTSAASQAP